MRRFILGIVMLMAVPAYAVGQQRDRSERSATGRTAVPREEAVQPAQARQAERRAEPRGETRTSSTHASTVAALKPGFRTALNPGFRTAALNPGFRSALNPGFRTTTLDPGLRPILDRERRRPFKRYGDYANVLFVLYAVPVVVEREVVVEAPGASAIVEQPSLARLILDIDSPAAQVFADGFYIGLPEDFRIEHGGAVLEPGPHRIDILARDYEPVSFDVNLTRGQSATFRHILIPSRRTTPPSPADAMHALPVAKQPSTFYLIPGCYIGNVPPKDANLPATCDIARAVSFQY